jgi:hypothetical protein
MKFQPHSHNEDKGGVTCNSFQNSNFDDVMVNIKNVVFEEKLFS